MIFNENLFLIALGLIWILGAVIQDLRSISPLYRRGEGQESMVWDKA